MMEDRSLFRQTTTNKIKRMLFIAFQGRASASIDTGNRDYIKFMFCLNNRKVIGHFFYSNTYEQAEQIVQDKINQLVNKQ